MVGKVLELVKPNLEKLHMKREGARALSLALKYGSLEQRRAIYEMLKPYFLSLAFGQHSAKLAKAMARLPFAKAELFPLVKKSIVKLMRSAESAEVAEQIFEAASGAQQQALVDSYFGHEPGVLETPYSEAEPRVAKLVEKALLPLEIVQRLLLAFVKATDVGIHQRLLEESSLVTSFPGLLSSRAGVSLACYFFTIAEARFRKHLVKAVKGEVKDYARNKATFLLLLKMLRDTDDTVLVRRALLSSLVEEAAATKEGGGLLDKVFQKLLGSLFAQDGRLLSQQEREALDLGLPHSTSKKEPLQRLNELLDEHNLTILESALAQQLDALLASESHLFIGSVSSYLVERGEAKSPQAKKVLALLGAKLAHEEQLVSVGGHRLAKQIIKAENKFGCSEFSSKVWAAIKGGTGARGGGKFVELVQERAAYVVVALLEHCAGGSGPDQVKNEILKEVKKHRAALDKAAAKKKEAKGLRLLLEVVAAAAAAPAPPVAKKR